MSAISGWKTASVKDLCQIGRGRVISGEEIEQHPGIYPVFSSQSKDNGRMGAIDTFDFEGEYVTWTTDGAYAGTVFHRTGKFNCTNVCGTLAAKDPDLSLAFLAYKLATCAKDHVSYVGNPKLMNGVMANIELSLPKSKPEQTKITEILSTVDRAIEQTEALIAKQQRLKTGLMQDLLTRGIDEHGNLRSEQTHEFKDSPLGRIPVEWEVCRLESVSDFVTSGSRGWAQYYSTEGALFLRIGNLTRHHINMRFDDVVRVNPPKSSEGNRTAVMCGDLLISITADLGIIAVIPAGFEEAYVNQHIALVRLSQSDVDPRFVGWFLNSRSGQSQFEKLNESGAKAGLNLPTIKNLLVPQMEVKEQHRIAEILDATTQKGSEFQQRLHKLRSLKTALMQDLLTGRKRVTELLNE